jgi:probable F420-dependent oxidoreductase
MAAKRPFRFAVLDTGTSLQQWQELARKAEDLGFSTLVVQDHFGEQFAPLLSIVAAAEVTSRLRFGSIVLDNDFRHPALLAKEAATVDVLTGGRLELGIGAGWLASDYEKIGLTFEAPAVRFGRLTETVQILKGFFSGEPVTFHGQHYQIENLDAFPQPVQKPRLPLMIGGRQKRMVSFAAREADIVSISMLDRQTPGGPKPPTFAEKVAWVRQAAGDRYDQIEIHANAFSVEITDRPREALERIANRLHITPEDALQSPANIVGSVESIAEQMQAWRERCDLSYFSLRPQLMDALAPLVARLANT